MKKLSTILILTHNYPVTVSDRQNAGIFVYDIVQEIHKTNPVVVFAPGSETKSEIVGASEVFRFKTSADKKLGSFKPWNPRDVLRFFRFFISGEQTLDNYIQNHNVKICVSMWAFPSGYFAYRLKKKYKIPYVIWILGSDVYVYSKTPILGRLIKKILFEANLLLADGIDLAHITELVSGKRCYFLPSGSNFTVPKKIFKEKKRTEEKIIITFLGRMEEVKGPDILIDALISLGKDLKKFKVHFVGEGSLLPLLREKINSSFYKSSVIFHGNIHDKSKIAYILSETDWVIIPSRSDSIPLAASEALKMGVPLIVSSLPDLEYLVKKYKVGYSFKEGTFRDLAAILIKLQSSWKEQKQFKLNTKKPAEIFSIERSATELIKKVTNIIQEK